MFLTGQASNVLGANLALTLVNVEVTWASWFVAAVVPGLLSCAVVPWVAYRCLRPTITRTPEAPLFARASSRPWVRSTRDQWIALLVFAGVGLDVDHHRVAPPRRDLRRRWSGCRCCS